MSLLRDEQNAPGSLRKNILRAAAVLIAVLLAYVSIVPSRTTRGQTQVIGEGTPHRIAKWIAPPPLIVTSCSGSPSPVPAGGWVNWFAEVSGGDGSRIYLWAGDAPLGGNTTNPVSVQYTSAGTKSGSVTVTSGAQQITAPCGTVTVTAGILSFTADPDTIDPGDTSTLSWATTGFGSCSITADPAGDPIPPIAPGEVGSGSRPVQPAETTLYTLTCNPGGKSASATVTVGGKPEIIEIPP